MAGENAYLAGQRFSEINGRMLFSLTCFQVYTILVSYICTKGRVAELVDA